MLRRFKRLRTAYHVTSGLTIVGMVKYTQFHFEGEGYAFRFWLALVACGMSWCAEFLKHRVPWFKRIMKRTLGPIAHESEFHTVNSATWFMTGLVVRFPCRRCRHRLLTPPPPPPPPLPPHRSLAAAG